MKLEVFKMIDDIEYARLATFELIGDEIESTYHDETAEYSFEIAGIYLPETGKLTPADGKKFMKNLKRAFSTSSRTVVAPELPLEE